MAPTPEAFILPITTPYLLSPSRIAGITPKYSALFLSPVSHLSPRLCPVIRSFSHHISSGMKLSTQANTPDITQPFGNTESGTYSLRTFDLDRDLPALVDICKDVYGGKDYLPNTAPSLVKDPKCRFLAVVNQENRPVAVANARRILPGIAWLEAVRTCPTQRGKGLARQLTQTLIDISSEEHNCEVYTCTIESNTPMRKVFDKVGMNFLHTIHQVKVADLAKLSGWAPEDNSDGTPKSFVEALGLEKDIGEAAKKIRWVPMKTLDELEEVLSRIKENGGIGYIPALYKIMSTEHVNQCLEDGLLWKMDSESAAVVAFYNDKQIQSLKSKRVCCIAATSTLALEGALWHVSSDECLKLLGEDRAFTLAVDGAVPILGNSLCDAIPFVDDPCVLF
eukprot:CAMPEP_0174905508 /NCGR_PEP_ID=MMETSP0167-20121228/53223_1 /TAXON_ID=38298 /ORGANISM="Rhodella maculata, Strain CCMP736" /LENGTH=393 /DNA_ID=CAMNT_0016148463 /DNA_START=33 /DNA_END=1211 /DNA_ORIENTATION=-